MMQLKKDEAVAVLNFVGYKHADGWDAKKIAEKLCSVPEVMKDGDTPQDENLAGVFDKVVAHAKENGKFEVEGEAAPVVVKTETVVEAGDTTEAPVQTNEPVNTEEPAAAPKRRGRPKGAKNKPIEEGAEKPVKEKKEKKERKTKVPKDSRGGERGKSSSYLAGQLLKEFGLDLKASDPVIMDKYRALRGGKEFVCDKWFIGSAKAAIAGYMQGLDESQKAAVAAIIAPAAVEEKPSETVATEPAVAS